MVSHCDICNINEKANSNENTFEMISEEKKKGGEEEEKKKEKKKKMRSLRIVLFDECTPQLRSIGDKGTRTLKNR